MFSIQIFFFFKLVELESFLIVWVRVHIVFSTLKMVSFIFPFQRHQEYWSTVAWSHEEGSIQHPGFERRDQLPQRVCSVI